MSWRDIFNDAELSGYRAGGHGQRIGFGAKAAMVVVDTSISENNPIERLRP
jgi:hypothetical protein